MSQDIANNNKRLAKNTLMLYLRMMFILLVTLYTSRVILNTLGIEDYGIYNVTGGVIAMFSFINSAMVSATQRYMTFVLGKEDTDKLSSVFSTSIQIHAIISLIIIVLGETIGLWFVLYKLVIPAERMEAAMVVYQCSIVASVVKIMSVPYNADIIAHEKMSAFAYISVLEVVLNLLVVYLLLLGSFDKLKLYAVLLLAVQFLIRFIYARYCNLHFSESHYRHKIDHGLIKEMTGFASWNFIGNIAHVLYTQGLNILLNLFFGPVVNAARGVSVQVLHAVGQFTSSFQIAVNPQITKSFAIGNFSQLHNLIYKSSRFSFFLLLLPSIPLFLDIDFVLLQWLKNVPENTSLFIRISILTSLISPFLNPCATANQATGQLKLFQTIVGGTLLLIVPLSYVVLKLGAPAYSVYIVHFIVSCIAQAERMILLRKQISLSIHDFIVNAYLPAFLVMLFSLVFPILVFINMEEGWLRLISVIIVSTISVLVATYYIGLKKNEREVIVTKVIAKISKFK